jgi:hypothetical protein
MAKKPIPHLYSDLSAFNRLLLLIATFLRYPGIGSAEFSNSSEQDHNALEAVQTCLQEMAHQVGIQLSSYSVNTIRKDLVMLRRYGILGQQMYRWGYYLGTGAMNPEELQVMLQALRSQAQQQGDVQSKQVLRTLERRLRGLNLQGSGALFYPVRTQINRSIVHTDPEEMMKQGQYRHTLFHHIDSLETAIVQGHKVELYRRSSPYRQVAVGHLQIYPLQLIYSEIAWYLLYEHPQNGHFAVERVDRLSNYFNLLDSEGRGIAVQQSNLQVAHKLLTEGWGLYLGEPDEQQQEKLGQLPLTQVIVRFFPPVTAFILEGECRHLKQKLSQGTENGVNYVDYQIDLPRRSIDEFYRWVNRFMNSARILVPVDLAHRHQQAALDLLKLYGS